MRSSLCSITDPGRIENDVRAFSDVLNQANALVVEEVVHLVLARARVAGDTLLKPEVIGMIDLKILPVVQLDDEGTKWLALKEQAKDGLEVWIGHDRDPM